MIRNRSLRLWLYGLECQCEELLGCPVMFFWSYPVVFPVWFVLAGFVNR